MLIACHINKAYLIDAPVVIHIMNCYICSRKPVIRFTYIDSLGSRFTEVRCKSCAKALKSNGKNEIEEEVSLNNKNNDLTNSTKDNKNISSSPYKKAWLSSDANPMLN